MRYTTRINNVRALEWGINMTQAEEKGGAQ